VLRSYRKTSRLKRRYGSRCRVKAAEKARKRAVIGSASGATRSGSPYTCSAAGKATSAPRAVQPAGRESAAESPNRAGPPSQRRRQAASALCGQRRSPAAKRSIPRPLSTATGAAGRAKPASYTRSCACSGAERSSSSLTQRPLRARSTCAAGAPAPSGPGTASSSNDSATSALVSGFSAASERCEAARNELAPPSRRTRHAGASAAAAVRSGSTSSSNDTTALPPSPLYPATARTPVAVRVTEERERGGGSGAAVGLKSEQKCDCEQVRNFEASKASAGPKVNTRRRRRRGILCMWARSGSEPRSVHQQAKCKGGGGC